MMERAKEFLRVAELASENGFYNGCAANCYYALFWITISAMAHAGFKQEKWSHDGLRKSFNQELILKQRVYPPIFGSWLLEAYEERLRAHYKEGAGIKRTKRLMIHAREFIAKVEEVIKR
jgi:uncharacterized protein (UPF0332 family)